MHVHKKVCHGDFNPSNIILKPDGQWYILDWSHATQGNASADVARTYLLFVLEGKEALAEKYLSLFCKKSDTAKQYVQQWIPIVAASQSLKGKPEERDLLIRWASVCEYEYSSKGLASVSPFSCGEMGACHVTISPHLLKSATFAICPM